jgi:hypothetical protein
MKREPNLLEHASSELVDVTSQKKQKSEIGTMMHIVANDLPNSMITWGSMDVWLLCIIILFGVRNCERGYIVVISIVAIAKTTNPLKLYIQFRKFLP